MRIFAMSDIHGCIEPLEARLAQLESLGFTSSDCADELMLLGDYVDRGPNSLAVIELLMNLCEQYPHRVFPLMGNHEDDLLTWLGANEQSVEDNAWLWEDDLMEDLPADLFDQQEELEARMLAWKMSDPEATTMRSLLGPAGWRAFRSGLRRRSTMLDAFDEACQRIRDKRASHIAWMRDLIDARETKHHLFVHAQVNESLGREWHVGTPREDFLNGRSHHRGSFIKNVIAGHTPTADLCGDPGFSGVLWDGASHFYIDGNTPESGQLPLLVWDSYDESFFEIENSGRARVPQLWTRDARHGGLA